MGRGQVTHTVSLLTCLLSANTGPVSAWGREHGNPGPACSSWLIAFFNKMKRVNIELTPATTTEGVLGKLFSLSIVHLSIRYLTNYKETAEKVSRVS